MVSSSHHRILVVADVDFCKLDIAGACRAELVFHLARGIGGQHRIAESGKRHQRRYAVFTGIGIGQPLVRNDAVIAIQDKGMRAETRREFSGYFR